MKNLILLLVVIQASTLIGQDFEYNYFDQSETNNLRDIFFVSEQVGYAASYLGPLIKSTDGGETWVSTSLENDLPILSIQFIDENYGFVVGGAAGCSPIPCDIPGSRIFKTIDGGDTWTETKLDEREFYTVYFIDSNIGFAAGLGNLFKTIDGGDSWSSIDLGEFYNIQEIKFINGIGYLSCLFGKMLKSVDGGETWQPLNTGITSHIYSFDFINEDVGFAGGQGEFIKTIDGGATWNLLPNAPHEIYSVTSLNADYIIASGRGEFTGGSFGISYGGIYFSIDGGDSWIANRTLDITSIAHTHFYSENLGFGVGLGSKILKLTVEDIVNFSHEILNEKNNWVFPNPAKEIIYFNDFDVIEGYSIAIVDMKGQKLIEEHISENELDISRLNNGLYIYQIYNDKKIIYGKFVKQ